MKAAEMTDDDKLLRVMEWTRISQYYYKDKDGNTVLDGTEWNPFTNIEQAMTLLYKMPFWSIEKIAGTHFVSVNGGYSVMAILPEQIPAAICNAIIKTMEG